MIENGQENQPNRPEAGTPTGEYKLLSDPAEILETWGAEIRKAGEGDKVWLRSMHCRDGKTMGYLEPRLIDANNNGADVRIIFDPISQFESLGLPSYVRNLPIPGRTQIKEEYERNTELEKRLRRAGIQIEYSRPKELKRQIFPYVGADHIKGTRIGDRFWFGDKNLEDISFERMKGFVIEIPNPEIIEELTNIIGTTTSPLEDQAIPIKSDPQTEIIWDAGIPGSSKIYETALEMIDAEPEFVGTSVQFYPNRKFLTALREAHRRDTRVEAITSSQEAFGPSIYYLLNGVTGKTIIHGVDNYPLPIAMPVVFAKDLAGIAVKKEKDSDSFGFAFVKPGGVHAKYVVTTDEVEFGTNNHSEHGVDAGTAELAIHTSNPQIVNLVREYHDNLFQASRN